MNTVRRIFGRAVGGVLGLAIAAGSASVAPVAMAAMTASPAVAQDQPAQPVQDKAMPVTRAVWNDAGDEVTLEVVTRTLKPKDGKGPTLLLVGAVHVGDGEYYRELQKILDESEVVLFEGVKPSGLGDLPPKEDSAACIAMTKSHLKLAGAVIAKMTAVPASREEIVEKATWPASDVVKSILRDGWGREMVYIAPKDGAAFDVVSLGADGKEGGEGADADLKMSDDPKPFKKQAGDNMQQKLAKALKLTYQLEEIKYDRKHFRNSDLSVDEVEKLLKDAGSSDEILTMLSGDSLTAKFAGMMLGLIKFMPSVQSASKAMMATVLSGDAEQLMKKAPGGAALQKVIIEDRNGAVYRDLETLVKDEPAVKTVAIFYGAGHFPTMQAELVKRGYVVDEKADRWLPAFRADLKGTGINRQMLESMMKSMTAK